MINYDPDDDNGDRLLTNYKYCFELNDPIFYKRCKLIRKDLNLVPHSTDEFLPLTLAESPHPSFLTSPPSISNHFG